MYNSLPNSVNEIYINIWQVLSIDVSKFIYDEYDTQCNVSIAMNGQTIYLKVLNDSQFEEFIAWFNKNMTLEKIRE